MTTTQTGSADLAALRARLTGSALLPDDPGWDAEVSGFNSAVTHRPAVVVAAGDASDVQEAVRYAADNGLSVGVQATGHGANVPMIGGLLVNTRRLDGAHVDPETRVATVRAGTPWGQVIEAAAPFGLAPLNGSSSGVGAVGYTVGGGVPVIGRTFGYAADYVTRLNVVTADGRLRQVDAASDPDLFWGLRGGGGSLGIVTAMTVGLVPVASVYGGGIFYAAAHVATAMDAWQAWCAGLPESVTTSVAILRLPPVPELPEPLRGQTVAHLRFCHIGSAADGADLIAPMRDAAPVLLDSIIERPYATIDAVHQDPDHPVPVCQRGVALRECTTETIDALLALAGPDVRTPLMLCEIRQLGGALSRPPAAGNAVGGRDAAFSLSAIGMLTPETATVTPAAVDALLAAAAPWASGHTLLNLHGAPRDDADRARPWDARTYQRLCEVRARVDPNGLFSYGHPVGEKRALS
jgi:hypothetical protein